MGVGRSNELLELACVIQLEVVADHGVDANVLTCLEETRLGGQAGRSGAGPERRRYQDCRTIQKTGSACAGRAQSVLNGHRCCFG